MDSLPVCFNPDLNKPDLSDSSFSPVNAVPSILLPSIDPTFAPIISRTWATVILEGIACGLINRSGITPSSVNGISSCSTSLPMIPFCPCLLANLSPSSGILFVLRVILTSLPESRDSVTYTLSTHPFSPCLTSIDDSLLSCACRKAPWASSRKRGGLVFPTRIDLPPSSLVSSCSGTGSPSLSRWEYESHDFSPFISSSPVPGTSILSSWPPGNLLFSALYVLMNADLPMALSTDALFIMTASCILYPWWLTIATTRFCPPGLSSKFVDFIALVPTIDLWG